MERIELVSPGGARLEVLTLGAAVDAWRPAPGDGQSVLVGWPVGRRLLEAQPYAGAVVGRYANRIAGASFVLAAAQHRLVANEGSSTLHGGNDGFDRRTWTVVGRSADVVTLRLLSPAGDQGFPGTLTAVVRYTLRDGSVEVVLAARTDAPTVVSLASHPYFDLGPAPVVMVPAERYLPVDEQGVPEPGSAPVEGTPFDLRGGRTVGHDSGLDHTFVVDGSGPRTVAVISSSDGRRGVRVESDQPTVQVYTGGPAGVALEAQREPDGPHRCLADVVLRPGDLYRSTTRWTYAEAAAR